MPDPAPKQLTIPKKNLAKQIRQSRAIYAEDARIKGTEVEKEAAARIIEIKRYAKSNGLPTWGKISKKELINYWMDTGGHPIVKGFGGLREDSGWTPILSSLINSNEYRSLFEYKRGAAPKQKSVIEELTVKKRRELFLPKKKK
jgi:hypothetical protein